MSDLVRIETSVDPREFLRGWRALAEDQLPFAVARALTRVATRARDEVRGSLPRRFELRSRSLAGTFRAESARKADWPHPTAVVGTLARSMLLQELGGVRTPQGRALAIPTRAIQAKRSKTTGKIPRGLLPSTLLERGTGAITEDGRIVRRVRKRTETAYLLRPRAQVDEALEFGATVRGVVDRELPGIMVESLDDALLSRRR